MAKSDSIYLKLFVGSENHVIALGEKVISPSYITFRQLYSPKIKQ
jgi:hypothetical protein